MSKTYYIYKITNTLSGKIYIGQSIEPRKRWRKHIYSSKKLDTNQYIHKAMNKYGVDSFTFEIIAEYNSLEECNQAEKDFIDKLKTRNKKFGYNIKPGGRKRGGWTHSEETKRNLSKNWKKVHGEDSIAAAREALRGRKLSKEHIDSIRKANTGNKRLVGYKQPQSQIDKRTATIAANYGSKVCSAEGCSRTDGYKHQGVRYCEMHVQRLIKTGSLEKKKRVAHNKGVAMSEKTRKKLSTSLKGRKAPNRIEFSEEDINLIISYTISAEALAEKFNVSRNVIKRVRRENKFTY